MKRLVVFVLGYLAVGAAVRPDTVGEVALVLIPGVVVLYVFSRFYASRLTRQLGAEFGPEVVAKYEREKRIKQLFNGG